MKQMPKNLKIFAKMEEGKTGLSIYLDFSGKREFLMFHRYNAMLYGLLKGGMTFDEVKRWHPSCMCRARQYGPRYRSDASVKTDNIMRHLIIVIDEYLLYE